MLKRSMENVSTLMALGSWVVFLLVPSFACNGQCRADGVGAAEKRLNNEHPSKEKEGEENMSENENENEKKPIDLALLLCDQLTQTPKSAQEVVPLIGKVERERPNVVYVKPIMKSLRRAMVHRDKSSGQVVSVSLMLAEPEEANVKQLEDELGPYDVPPKVSWDEPTKMLFYIDKEESRPFTCTLVVDVQEAAGGELQGGKVVGYAIRRDPR